MVFWRPGSATVEKSILKLSRTLTLNFRSFVMSFKSVLIMESSSILAKRLIVESSQGHSYPFAPILQTNSNLSKHQTISSPDTNVQCGGGLGVSLTKLSPPLKAEETWWKWFKYIPASFNFRFFNVMYKFNITLIISSQERIDMSYYKLLDGSFSCPYMYKFLKILTYRTGSGVWWPSLNNVGQKIDHPFFIDFQENHCGYNLDMELIFCCPLERDIKLWKFWNWALWWLSGFLSEV